MEDILSVVNHDQIIGHPIRSLDVMRDDDLGDMLLTL